MQRSNKLIIAGSIGVDTIEAPAGIAKNVLGGSAIFASMAAAFFCETVILSAIGNDLPYSLHEVMRDRKVNLDSISHIDKPNFKWHGKYSENLNDRESIKTTLGVLEDLTLHIPENLKSAQNIFLGNLNPEIQLTLIEEITKPKMIGVDTMNFWIESNPKLVKQVLSKANLIIINDSESRQLTGEYSLLKVFSSLREFTDKDAIIIIKKGEHGSLTQFKDKIMELPAFPLRSPVDPTGAGDTFAGSVMGYLTNAEKLNHEEIKNAISIATIIASFCVDDFSIRKLSSLTDEEIQERLHTYNQLGNFVRI